MAKDTVKFTVRLNPETAKKLVYVAEYLACKTGCRRV